MMPNSPVICKPGMLPVSLRMPSKWTCKTSEKPLTSKMKDQKKSSYVSNLLGTIPMSRSICLIVHVRTICTSKYDARKIPFQYLKSSNYSDVYTTLVPGTLAATIPGIERIGPRTSKMIPESF